MLLLTGNRNHWSASMLHWFHHRFLNVVSGKSDNESLACNTKPTVLKNSTTLKTLPSISTFPWFISPRTCTNFFGATDGTVHLFYIQVKTVVRRPFGHILESMVSFSNSHLHYFELVRIGLWVLLLTGNGNYWSASMLHWLQGRLIPLISYFHWILWSVKAAWSPSLVKLVQDRSELKWFLENIFQDVALQKLWDYKSSNPNSRYSIVVILVLLYCISSISCCNDRRWPSPRCIVCVCNMKSLPLTPYSWTNTLQMTLVFDFCHISLKLLL